MTVSGCDPRDRGSSLIVVLVLMTVLSIFASVGLAYAASTMRVVDRSEDNQQALSAAEAGVADYLARLNRAEDYWKSYDCSNDALKGPAAKGSCGWTETTPVGWRTVPGTEGRSKFHYDVSTATTYTRGSIVLTSTGQVGKATRSVQVTLRRGGFGEFLYYTVFETTDPANQLTYGSSTKAQNECPRYWWANPSRTSYCSEITFTTGDVLRGPLHSNDTILMTGTPNFQGTVTTSDPACKAVDGVPPPARSCYRTNSSANPTFGRGIAYRSEVTLADTISELRQYVVKSDKNPVPGCLYTGPTRIRFLPTAAGATPKMKVWSRWTPDSGLPSYCGTGSALRSQAGAEVPVPQENLIYVQDVPSTQKSPAVPTVDQCKTTTSTRSGIGDNLPQMSAKKNVFEATQYLRDANCTYGSAWIEGPLKGRVTVTTDNDIVITGDLTYAGGKTGTDALGLVAKNSVKVYHPFNCEDDDECTDAEDMEEMDRPTGGRFKNPKIYAAIQSLQHSFTVQYYDRGSTNATLGKLEVFGAIAQRYRGPVGKGNFGYLKDYTYDTRLRYAPPPYFLDPVRSGWGQKTFGEVQARYRP